MPYSHEIPYQCAGKRTGAVASLGSRGPEGPEDKSTVIDSHVISEARSPQVPLKTHLGKVLASVHYMFSE